MIARSAEAPRFDTKVRVICATSLAELRSLRREWNSLVMECPTATVFQTWEWVTLWYEHFAGEAELRVWCVRDTAGRLVGVAPFLLHRAAFGMRQLHLLGPAPYLTEYMDVLVLPSMAATVVRALFAAWEATRADWDLLMLSQVPKDSIFLREARAIAAGRHYRLCERTTNAGVRRPLPGSWGGVYGTLRRPMKTYLNNLANRLARDGHQARMVVSEDPIELAKGVDLLIDWHRQRAQLQDRLFHFDHFQHPAGGAFLHAVARELTERRIGQLCLLYVDEQPVAAQLCLVFQGVLYRHYSGYDPRWAWYGVMATLFRHCIAHALAQGCTKLDLLLGPNQEKLRWGGELYPVQTVMLAHPGPRSSTAYAWLRLRSRARPVRQRVRAYLQPLRRRLRHVRPG